MSFAGIQCKSLLAIQLNFLLASVIFILHAYKIDAEGICVVNQIGNYTVQPILYVHCECGSTPSPAFTDYMYSMVKQDLSLFLNVH